MKNNLQKYRVWKNLTQKELAKKVNLNMVTISNIENGKIKPHETTKKKLAQFFNISIKQLFIKEKDD